MGLPKVKYPIYDIEIPSFDGKIQFRPFTVDEEILLATALESNDIKEQTNLTKQAINNCILMEDFNVNKLASFEIEYLFLQIRAKSISDKVSITLTGIEKSTCEKCKEQKTIEIPIDEIKLDSFEKPKDIKISETLGIKMKYPPASSMMDVMLYRKTLDRKKFYEIISECIECIYDQETVYEIESKEELMSWIKTIPSLCVSELNKFLENIPKLSYEIKTICEKCGRKESLMLEGLEDFLG